MTGLRAKPQYVVPLTKPMRRTLSQMEVGRSTARVVAVMDGLPVLRYPSGTLALLLTTGRLERIRPDERR